MSRSDDDNRYIFDHEMSRRDFLLDSLAAGGLMASGLTLPFGMSQAAPPDDEVVRIGYIPITDATALLVAHAKGFFKDEGVESADTCVWLGAAGQDDTGHGPESREPKGRLPGATTRRV